MSKLTVGNSRLRSPELHSGRDQNELMDVGRFRLITKGELRRMVPYTPQHILRLEKRGLFPRRIQVGTNRVAWLLSEVEQWVATRVAERDANSR